jgi:hypothetical protein
MLTLANLLMVEFGVVITLLIVSSSLMTI